MAYLCFDIGSSTLKAAVLSEDGGLLGLARRQLRSSGEGIGVDPIAWAESAFSAGPEALALAHIAPRAPEIRAISVSGHGPTLLAIGADGHPMGPALSWIDRSAIREAEEVSALAGREIDPSFSLPKALRLWRGSDQAHKDRIRWFLSCPEYLIFKLCGEALAYLPHPGFAPYVWSEALLDSLGLPRDRFPPLAPPAIEAGRLVSEAADRLGLAAGVPVITGFPDFLAAIVGSGAIEPGIVCDRSGTSEALNLCATKPFPSRALLSLPLPFDGLWNLSGGVSTAGAALEWLARALDPSAGAQKKAAVTELLADASVSPPGANGLVFLPYLSGERAPLWMPELRGAFAGLSLSHGRSDLARAAAESIVYGLRLAADLAREGGFPLTAIRVSGQAALEDFLCILKADILEARVERPAVPDCELVGDAAACAAALGDASSLAEASRSLVRLATSFEPNPKPEYNLAYQLFKATLDALMPRGNRP